MRERIAPVIDKMLAEEKFVYSGSFSDDRTIDDVVRGSVKCYLDERVFLYSKTSDAPSERLRQTSGGSGSPTRLEAFLRFSIERYCDDHLREKLTPVITEFLKERGGVESVAREQMAALLREKFKLY